MLVVEGAILEAKDQPTLDAVALGDLEQIAVSYGLAAHRPDDEQPVGGSLGEPHLDGRSLETGPEREDHEDGQSAKPEKRDPRSLRCDGRVEVLVRPRLFSFRQVILPQGGPYRAPASVSVCPEGLS